jgi:hypothetical protein
MVLDLNLGPHGVGGEPTLVLSKDPLSCYHLSFSQEVLV